MLFKKFIDRKSDVVRLGEALKRPGSQFIVVYGRRRIGKSSLIKNVAGYSPATLFIIESLN